MEVKMLGAVKAAMVDYRKRPQPARHGPGPLLRGCCNHASGVDCAPNGGYPVDHDVESVDDGQTGVVH